ncbi:sushi, von Willebrand factor type A, EGF and pentraxin domain-containing protein 1-like [Lineus longissimus]|uniref:sushi, von Willebrand factor type A, EGF and pentraxin domain-containing protein 1-like n=1 Tax=Lineus longissimus TaxID=88925 RepID=UPI00315DA2C4
MAESECKKNTIGTEYKGTQNTTLMGFTCADWLVFEKARYRPADSYNYCRNPDGDARGPWCYITATDPPPYDNCFIPPCKTCQTKRYGPNCNNRCQCANDDTCDDKTGQCPSGCKDFFTGPYCNIAITCDPPSRLLNGKVSTTFLATVGWFVSYKCDKGFVLEGKENSTCVENVYGPGNVADSTPVCRAITCDPPSLTNGQVSVPKPVLLGSAVSYQCNTGYVLEGKESSTCVEVGTGNVKGSWADPTPVCTAITCDPPSLTNGRVSGPKPALLGSAVSYQCDTGYVLEGKGSSTCVEDGPDNVKGKWADPAPVCTAITCEPPVISNGHV